MLYLAKKHVFPPHFFAEKTAFFALLSQIMFHHTDTLLELGLSPITADLYILLMERGESSPSLLQEATGLSRAAVHDGLNELLADDLVEYRKEGRRAFYTPVHPQKLEVLLEQKKRDMALLAGETKETIRSLAGSYALNLHKPGVQFYEGMDGFAEALDDTLTAKEPIRTIVDVDAVAQYAEKENRAYIEKRNKLGKQKKILIVDTPQARAYMERVGRDHTTTRFLPKALSSFPTGLQIYDNKVLFLTLREKNTISVLVEDPEIYTIHKNLFDFLWGLQDGEGTQQAVNSR